MTTHASPFTDAAATWDQRFAADHLIFGEQPNEYLRAQAGRLRAGSRALCVADGEGRNSVWLARQGLQEGALACVTSASQQSSPPPGMVGAGSDGSGSTPPTLSPALVITLAGAATALEAARASGWEIVAAVPQERRIEAVATTFWFGFKDDIVVRIRPAPGGSRIDVRSVSRVGRSDLGTNAKRIRAFLGRLAT